MTTTKATVTTFGPARFVAMRHVGPFQECGPTWQRMMHWLEVNKVEFSATGTFVLDNPMEVESKDIRKDIAAMVESDYQTDDSDVRMFDVPEIKVVTSTLEGGYEGLPDAWGELSTKGLESTGAKPDGKWTFEIYRNNPATVAKEDLRIDLYLSVE